MTGRKAHIRTSLAFLFVLGAAAFAGPAGAQSTEEQLEDAKARLGALEAEAAQATARYEEAHEKLIVTREEIAETEAALVDARKDVGKLQGQLDERARAAYTMGGTGTLELLLTSDSLSDFSDRVVFLDRLAEDDADLVTRLDVLTEELRRREAALDQLEKEQAEAEAAAEAEADTVYAKLAEAQALREELEDELAAEERAARLAAQAAAAPTGGGGGDAPGSIPTTGGGALQACPAPGTSFTDTFGAPRSGGRTHAGVDMMGNYGMPIYAAQSGSVSFSSSELGGNQAHVNAAGGDYTFYAHLQSFADVSGNVSAGTLIGYMGDTGNAVGTPHLHFEYHPGGSLVNPTPYVAAVC